MQFITEFGTSKDFKAEASVIKATIELESNFDAGATCIVGMATCSLATGVEAGVVLIKKQEFVAPNKIEVTVELPGVGIPGSQRDLYSAVFNYAVIGKSAR